MSAGDWCESVLGGTRRGREVICDCIFCGKDGHMYVNGTTGLAYCFVCGAGANLAQLIAELEGVDEDYAFIKAQRILGGEHETRATSQIIAQAYLRLLNRSQNNPDAEQILTLPSGCVPLDDARAASAVSYLKRRGFTERHWARYAPLFCVKPSTDPEKKERRFKKHIVFSNTNENGALNFYTTRAAFDPDGFPKSYHPGGAKRGGILFGEFALRDSVIAGNAPLYIVEGPLDMLALSGYAVALIGKFMSEEQAITASKYKRVVVALDSGELRDAANACKSLKRAGVRHIRICTRYPNGLKDPGDMAVLRPTNAVRAIYNVSAEFTPSIELTAKFGRPHR